MLLFGVVRPHDGCGLASVEVTKAIADAYAIEAIHLQCFTNKGYPVKAVGYYDVCRDTLIVGAGLFFLGFVRMGRISPAGAYAKRKAADVTQAVKVLQKLGVHVVPSLSCMRTIEFFESKVFHLRATPCVFSHVLRPPSPSIPKSTGIISLRSKGGTVIGDSVIVSTKLQIGTNR